MPSLAFSGLISDFLTRFIELVGSTVTADTKGRDRTLVTRKFLKVFMVDKWFLCKASIDVVV